MGNPCIKIRYEIMFSMSIPKLIHLFLCQHNSGTLKLVKTPLLIVYFWIFCSCWNRNFPKLMSGGPRFGGWKNFWKLIRGTFIKHQRVSTLLTDFALISQLILSLKLYHISIENKSIRQIFWKYVKLFTPAK